MSPASPVVMKFGGTSVADADAMTRVVNIVRRQWESQPKGSRPPVVVVSALSKVTDGLIRTTEFARKRRRPEGRGARRGTARAAHRDRAAR